ncbi:MAG TPA: type II toxin-antitoxin system VapC family toxin [Candidatus Aquilonibacter sp.]|nr:type II toxin-antitoxin system VapC family toxin [Candidatus Aquilonibacter sp.]
MLIGLDTNVVIRLLVDDEPGQAERAQRVLDERTSAQDPAFIDLLVIAETFWALDRVYKVPRPKIGAAIRELLNANNVTVEHADDVRIALEALDHGADFADALVAARNQRAGCTTTVTFDDRAAKRLASFELI